MISVVVPTIKGRGNMFAMVANTYLQHTPHIELIVAYGHPTVGDAWQWGADRARGDYIHLGNDDCQPHKGWWQPAVEACDAGFIPSPMVYDVASYPQSLPEWGKVAPDWTPVHCSMIPFLSRAQWEAVQPLFTGHYSCPVPETRVLTSDLRWIEAGKLSIGDELVGVDEFPEPRCDRRFRRALVTGNGMQARPCATVRLADGREVTCSVDHPWLVKSWRRGTPAGAGQSHLQWIATVDLRPGDEISAPFRTWDTESSYGAGWLAGIIDGEGTAGRYGSGRYQATRLSIAQNAGVVLDGIKAGLDRMGIRYTEAGNAPHSRVRTIHVNAVADVMELVGRLSPGRIRPAGLWEGAGIRSKPARYATVAEVAPAGTREVVALGTDTGTFLAEGMVSHNTDNFITWRAERGGWPCRLRTGYAFTHHWAQPGRGAGMTEMERMTYDAHMFEQAKAMVEAGAWDKPWPEGGRA